MRKSFSTCWNYFWKLDPGFDVSPLLCFLLNVVPLACLPPSCCPMQQLQFTKLSSGAGKRVQEDNAPPSSSGAISGVCIYELVNGRPWSAAPLKIPKFPTLRTHRPQSSLAIAAFETGRNWDLGPLVAAKLYMLYLSFLAWPQEYFLFCPRGSRWLMLMGVTACSLPEGGRTRMSRSKSSS